VNEQGPAVATLPFMLSLWKEQSLNWSPGAFIFPNKKCGFMDSNNYRKRVLHGLGRELELPKLAFQVIRRTIATLAQKKGTVKDIQGVLRHSRMSTTTDVYTQEIPESTQKTVDAINAELRTLPNLEGVTRGTSVLLPNATKPERRSSVST
jgi:integrase